MKLIKQLWVNLSAPLLILNSAVLMFLSSLTMSMSNDLEAGGILLIIALLLFIITALIGIGLVLGLNIYTLVKTIKEKNVVGIILTLLVSCFYVPFYHQKKNNWSIAWPIVSVSLMVLNYIIFFISYFIYIFNFML